MWLICQHVLVVPFVGRGGVKIVNFMGALGVLDLTVPDKSARFFIPIN